jgi:hypothetical protein
MPETSLLPNRLARGSRRSEARSVAVYFLKKILYKQKIPVTSNLRYMYGVLNVDEIKN